MEKEVFIFGHKNPDTDSICSSLVRERLDKKNGWDCTVAKRLGKINKETEYVLNYLKISATEMLDEIEERKEVILVDNKKLNQSAEEIGREHV